MFRCKDNPKSACNELFLIVDVPKLQLYPSHCVGKCLIVLIIFKIIKFYHPHRFVFLHLNLCIRCNNQ